MQIALSSFGTSSRPLTQQMPLMPQPAAHSHSRDRRDCTDSLDFANGGATAKRAWQDWWDRCDCSDKRDRPWAEPCARDCIDRKEEPDCRDAGDMLGHAQSLGPGRRWGWNRHLGYSQSHGAHHGSRRRKPASIARTARTGRIAGTSGLATQPLRFRDSKDFRESEDFWDSAGHGDSRTWHWDGEDSVDAGETWEWVPCADAGRDCRACDDSYDQWDTVDAPDAFAAKEDARD